VVALLAAGGPATEVSAVAAVEKLRGRVERDDKQPGKPVVLVDLYYTKATDADLKGITSLEQVRSLDLGSTKVTDEGLKEFAALKQLRSLDLSHTKVRDAGLRHLAPLKQLQVLRLWSTKVTDKGLMSFDDQERYNGVSEPERRN
jgi:hypothetical protein